MAKKAKKPAAKKRGKYDTKLKVKGSFTDVINVALSKPDKKN